MGGAAHTPSKLLLSDLPPGSGQARGLSAGIHPSPDQPTPVYPISMEPDLSHKIKTAGIKCLIIRNLILLPKSLSILLDIIPGLRVQHASCLTVVTTKPAVVYLLKTTCPQDVAVGLIYETDLHIPPLPLAGKCYFSAPPCACHLVPPIPDGTNTVQLGEQSWCSGVRTSSGDCSQGHEASCMVGRPGVVS